MKYYEIVLYSTGAVQRINCLPENDVLKFKQWLTSDSIKPYVMTFENSIRNSNTKSTVIFKNNLLNVDFDVKKVETC